MRIRAVLSAAVLACSVSACTGGAKPAQPRATATPGDVISQAERPPLTFRPKPLWTDATKGVPHHADSFTVHRGRVVMFSGPEGGDADRLSVVDAATGATRWSVLVGVPFPGGRGDVWAGRGAVDAVPQVVDRDGDWGVLITTMRLGDRRQSSLGLALLSGEDGHVLWHRPVVPAKRSPAHDVYAYPSLLLTDGRVAAVSLHPVRGGKVADLKLAAVDVRTGKPLWTRTGIVPTAVTAGSVVTSEWPVRPGTPLDDAGPGTVTVLDAMTGRTRWSLRDRMPNARMAATAGGLLLVRGQQGGIQAEPVVLDLATGTELARLPKQTLNCFDDRTELIVCGALPPAPRLSTIRSDERRVRVAGHAPPDGSVITAVRDGRIYYSSVSAPGQELDRSGTPLVGHMPDGFLRAIDDKYAVFGSPRTQTYQVYRVD